MSFRYGAERKGGTYVMLVPSAILLAKHKTSTWLDVLNAELFPKRYWRGSKPQEVGEEGDYT